MDHFYTATKPRSRGASWSIFAPALILDRLREGSKIHITLPGLAGVGLPLPGSVFGKLAEHCLADLTNGGRGIGNALESALINPLSRALFERSLPEGTRANITAIEWNGVTPTIRLEVLP